MFQVLHMRIILFYPALINFLYWIIGVLGYEFFMSFVCLVVNVPRIEVPHGCCKLSSPRPQAQATAHNIEKLGMGMGMRLPFTKIFCNIRYKTQFSLSCKNKSRTLPLYTTVLESVTVVKIKKEHNIIISLRVD